MANQVYANNMEVACKAAAGKSICAFPDVCFTPPQTPATPPGVPVPYPSTGLASDCTDGSTSVQISGQEVMLRNKSYFKKSTGDEAGCAPKKGVITGVNRGKVYFNAWSMDVKVDGENVVRMLDLATHNHASVPGESPSWPYIDEASVPVDLQQRCASDKAREDGACSDCKPKGSADHCADTDVAKACRRVRRCMLTPYRIYDKESGKDKSPCCPGQTGHHLIPKSFASGFRVASSRYSSRTAPCICVEGRTQRIGTHGQIHAIQEAAIRNLSMNGEIEYRALTRSAARAARWVFIESQCSPDCIEAQLDAYHTQFGIRDDTAVPVRRILGYKEALAHHIRDIGFAIQRRLGRRL